MFTLTGMDKYCGTCEYWQGRRSIEYYGSRVEIPDINEKAKCKVPSLNLTWGPNGCTSPYCQYYKKLAALD